MSEHEGSTTMPTNATLAKWLHATLERFTLRGASSGLGRRH
jgi:hypothetical protein